MADRINLNPDGDDQPTAGQIAGIKEVLGLDSVDNTADSAKPVSTAQQTALDLKANAADVSNVDNTSDANKPVSTAQQAAIDLKANAADVSNVDNTSDANKPVSTAQQAALDGKVDTPGSNTTWATTELALNTRHERSTTLASDPTWTIASGEAEGDFVEVYFTTDGTDRTVIIPAAKRLDVAGTTGTVTTLTFKANANHFMRFTRFNSEWKVASTANE